MIKLSYDLHIHSCLSPCGDDDMTPGNIVGMAALKELDVIAVTDHNSCKNCQAVLQLAKGAGIVAIPGLELCTMEEVHVICLFLTLKSAMDFDCYVESKIIPFPNKESIFGKQNIVNEKDEVIGVEKNLLINATKISFDQVYELTKRYQGIMIPAHIDKNSNSLLSNLGFVPPDSKFSCVEVKNLINIAKLRNENPYLKECGCISNSDAHYLEHMNEAVNFLYSESRNIQDIFYAITNNLQC